MIIKNSAIILAGGTGSRFGESTPKQFLNLNGSRVIDYSIYEFIRHLKIDEVIIVVHKEWKRIIAKENRNCKVIVGGDTRTASSLKGLEACNKSCQNVFIHDAARPIVNRGMIDVSIRYFENSKYDAVVPVIQPVDSYITDPKLVKNNIRVKGNMIKYNDRNTLKIIQTPQVFRYSKILSAYKNIDKSWSDDLSVLIKYNQDCNVMLTDGSFTNIKITNPIDLKIAESLLNNEK
tara:strand:- start:357 stop:1058 length:702 start_codon:yes stop_codon:yes gene_type:complete